MNTDHIVWTIGHSTRDFDDFLTLLKMNKIELLVDIRSFPGSRKYPQYNKENLMVKVPENNIEYFHLVQLGGRRKVNPDSNNLGWHHPAFRGYADYMETTAFDTAIHELEQLALQKRVAYMCSEAVWWRCHRLMVSDWMKCNGWKVLHILSKTEVEEHPYTQPARIVNGKVIYTLADTVES